MKYIRTKGGIFEVIELHTTTNENGSFISDYFCKGLRTILAEEVIDVSLSIKELCDEFVVVGKNRNSKTALLDLAKEYAKCGIKTYGAIWTDKGLIYKAKMKGVLPNDEIDWELL